MNDNLLSENATKILRNLIAYFIQRQRLAILAMLQVRPDILRRTQDFILGIEIEGYYRLFESQEAEQNDGSLFHGVWQQEWQYRIHGVGCELINLRTSEPIEWDAPYPEAFRLEWFWENLIWRTTHEPMDAYVRLFTPIFRQLPENFHIEEILIAKNMITPKENGTYVLLNIVKGKGE